MTTTSSDLSHVTTASRLSECLASNPTTPVLIHWQLTDFPVRIATKLLRQRDRVLWVVSTNERGDIAEQQLSAAGITVHRVRTEDDLSEDMTGMALYRYKRQRKLAARGDQYPEPDNGTITIVNIGRLGHERPLNEIARWESALVVFDHLGVAGARWMEKQEGWEGLPPTYVERDRTSHPIQAFHSIGLPLVFIARDELEVELHGGYFAKRGAEVKKLGTRFKVPSKLVLSAIGSDLVWSRYATGAFLSVLACSADIDVVGEALIGGITPDKLSMRTSSTLTKAVLKIAHHSEDVMALDRKQTELLDAELTAIRMRDFVRTTMLAFDPSAKRHELVVICPTNRVAAVAAFCGVQPQSLPNWNANRPELTISGTTMVQEVVKALSCYPSALAHGGRRNRVLRVLETEQAAGLPAKLGRLALSLHSASGQDLEWDLSKRAEDLVGATEQATLAVNVFNRMLDDAFPWSASVRSEPGTYLQARKEVLSHYRKHREERLKKAS